MKASIETNFKESRLDKIRIRREVAEKIKKRIHDRVRYGGRGAEGKLKGYSERTVVMSKPPAGEKRMKKPRKGWNTLHRGGYKEYKEDSGQVSTRFTMENMGDLWNDWNQTTQAPTGDLLFGFSKSLNSDAADKAIENGRDDMLDLSQAELDEIATAYLEQALDQIWP